MTITVIMNVPHVTVNFFPLQQGGTPQEFVMDRDDDSNVSVFVILDGVKAYMTHDASQNRNVYMDTQVAKSESYTLCPQLVETEIKPC